MPRPKKEIKITDQLTVGLVAEEAEAVKVISTFACISPSQYGRRAIQRQLIEDRMIEHPAQRLAAANAAKS
jgi:hypothetical protein